MGEYSVDSLRLRMLNTEAHSTAPSKSSIPVTVFSAPSFESRDISAIALREIAENITCDRVGLSLRNKDASIITTTGTRDIITPEIALEVRLIPNSSNT